MKKSIISILSLACGSVQANPWDLPSLIVDANQPVLGALGNFKFHTIAPICYEPKVGAGLAIGIAECY